MSNPAVHPAHSPLFVSHGPPTLVLGEYAAREFLSRHGAAQARPRAFVVVSAHWESKVIAVSGAAAPDTIHDFRGFPEVLYRLRYPAPGSPEVAGEVARALGATGIECVIDPHRGLDHGAWAPLLLLRPAADVPVVQVSLPADGGAAAAFALGEALAPLAHGDLAIVASGGITHNLAAYRGQPPESAPPGWVSTFAEWVADALARGDREALADYRARGPGGALNHPSEEHFAPLLVALGAGGAGARAERLHASYAHGVLAMDVYAFVHEPA